MAQRELILSLKSIVCTYTEFWIRFWGLKHQNKISCRDPLRSIGMTGKGLAWHAGGQRFESAWLHSQNSFIARDLGSTSWCCRDFLSLRETRASSTGLESWVESVALQAVSSYFGQNAEKQSFEQST